MQLQWAWHGQGRCVNSKYFFSLLIRTIELSQITEPDFQCSRDLGNFPVLNCRAFRLAFTLGLIAAPLLWRLFAPLPEIQLSASFAWMLAAGLVVGVGVKLGSGCTSGHGVCGLARLSPRSLAATLSFMAAGFITVWLLRHGLGG